MHILPVVTCVGTIELASIGDWSSGLDAVAFIHLEILSRREWDAIPWCLRARTFAFIQANIHLANNFSDESAASSSLNKCDQHLLTGRHGRRSRLKLGVGGPFCLPRVARNLIVVHPIPIEPFTLIENIACYLWWTGRCCLYSLVSRGMLVLETVNTSPLSGVVPMQHSLILGAGPYCGLTGTWSEELVQNFHRSVTCHRPTDRSWYLPLLWPLDPYEKSHPRLLWTVVWRYCTLVDVVHPQSGKFQSACATV